MAQDWDIKPRSETCAACQTPFGDGQAYFAALAFGEEGYVRADYCGPCWERSEKAKAPYSTWTGVYRLPPPKPEEPLKKETAESLMRRLIETEDPAKVNGVFILAVMLERKRILTERDVQIRDDGAMIRIYEHRRTGETFLIRDPRLGLDQIEAVQREIVALLGGEAEGEVQESGAGSQEPEGAAAQGQERIAVEKQ